MDQKIEKSLSISWKEGIPASMMLAFLDYYLVPYGLFLGASNRWIAVLVGLPQLMASIAQLAAVEAVRLMGNRLRFIVITSLIQATLLLPMALLAVAIFPGTLSLLVALAVAFRMLNNLIGTAWGSLMSEYLPPRRRGRYFGWRSRVVGMAGVGGVALGGLVLFLMKGISLSWGFCLLFLIAAAFRYLSAFLLGKMADLLLTTSPGADFTLVMFLRRFKESNFVKFVLYTASIMFAIAIAGPYFSV